MNFGGENKNLVSSRLMYNVQLWDRCSFYCQIRNSILTQQERYYIRNWWIRESLPFLSLELNRLKENDSTRNWSRCGSWLRYNSLTMITELKTDNPNSNLSSSSVKIEFPELLALISKVLC